MPLPREVGSDSTAALEFQVTRHSIQKAYGAGKPPVRLVARPAACSKLKLIRTSLCGACPLEARAIEGLSWLRGPAERCLCSTSASRDTC